MYVGKEDEFGTVQNAYRIKDQINRGGVQIVALEGCNHLSYSFGFMEYLKELVEMVKFESY